MGKKRRRRSKGTVIERVPHTFTYMLSNANIVRKAFTPSCQSDSFPNVQFFSLISVRHDVVKCITFGSHMTCAKSSLREPDSVSSTFCPCGMRTAPISRCCLAGLMMAHNNREGYILC